MFPGARRANHRPNRFSRPVRTTRSQSSPVAHPIDQDKGHRFHTPSKDQKERVSSKPTTRERKKMPSLVIQFPHDTPSSHLFRMNLQEKLRELGGSVRVLESFSGGVNDDRSHASSCSSPSSPSSPSTSSSASSPTSSGKTSTCSVQS